MYRIKNEYSIRNAKEPLNHFSFCNKKYHYIVVITANTLLAKLLSNWDGDKFCLNCFGNIQMKN